MELYLKIDTKIVGIQWDADNIDDIVTRMFAVWHTSPGKSDYWCTINVRKNGFNLETPLHSAECPHKNALAADLEYGLTLLSLDIFSHKMQIHASCVDFNGEGVLFVGSHGIGKTTLALTAIASGFRALTDDVAIIGDNHTQVFGFPRPFKVCDDIRNKQPSIIPKDCPYLKVTSETTYLFFYLPHRRYYAESTSLKYIVFPVLNEKPTTIREIGETESLRKLLTQGFNLYQKKNGRINELLDIIRKTRSLEISYNSNWDLIKKVNELVRDY